MACPFAMEEDRVPQEDPDESVPVHTFVVPARARAGRDRQQDLALDLLLAEAEEIVTRAAEAIPLEPVGQPALPAGRPVSLGERLRDKGPLAVGVGAAAGVAIRAVAKGFAGGGFHFPQVFDPLRPVRAR